MLPFWVIVGVGLLVLLTLGLVLFGGYLLWRDGYVRGWRAGRKKPPTCLRCGYDLSGLSHCRCPECGTTYRLDELWRAHLRETFVDVRADVRKSGSESDPVEAMVDAEPSAPTATSGGSPKGL